MTYLEREQRYDREVRKKYMELSEIANASPYPNKGNGMQYYDFTVGGKDSKVEKVRILIDFRGESFTAFFLGTMLPEVLTSRIRSAYHFTAREAYDFIIGKAQLINKTN